MARIEPGPQSVQGGDGDDVLTGTWDSDILWGNGGDDVLRGEGGYDILLGHAGNDRLYGGDDPDSLDGGAGDDLLYGGAGDDSLLDPDGGNDSLWGEDGNDSLNITRYGAQQPTLFLSGGAGNDDIRIQLYGPGSGGGQATVLGDDGDDQVWVSGVGAATVDLGAGNDWLSIGGSGMGAFTISLGAGRDVIEFTGSRPGETTITDFTAGDSGDRIDLLRSLDMMGGTASPDVNPFQSGAVTLRQVGADVHLSLGGYSGIVLKNVVLSALTASNFGGCDPSGGAGFPGASFVGSAQAEQIWGSWGNDRIEGLDEADTLYGQDGDDLIFGGEGNDWIDGGRGHDVIHGGDGNDIIRDSDIIAGGNDLYFGEAGSDQISVSRTNGAGERVSVWGGDGDDYLGGSGGRLGDLLLDGGAGNDSMGVGNVDRWVVDGGDGDDSLGITHAYRDSQIFFGEGVFRGGSGFDNVTLTENSQHLQIIGIDASSFRIGASVIHDVEQLTVRGWGVLDLSRMTHGLTVVTTTGREVLTGTAYDDVIGVYAWKNQVDAGAGFDTVFFPQDRSRYSVSMVDGVIRVRHDEQPLSDPGDVIVNVERLQFADGWYTPDGLTKIPAILHGSADDDVLTGRTFGDTIFAGSGNDIIRMTAGNDLIDGGDGHDIFDAFGLLPDGASIKAVGDDFVFSSYLGMVHLTRVESIRFFDGTIVELNRMYGSGDAPAGKDGPTGPEVLPGPELFEDPGSDSAQVLPALLNTADPCLGPSFDQDAPARWHPDWY